MFRIPDSVQIQIEKIAAESLRLHGDTWYALTKPDVLARQESNLKNLEHLQGVSVETLLAEGPSREPFCRLLVEQAIYQTLLTGIPSYR